MLLLALSHSVVWGGKQTPRGGSANQTELPDPHHHVVSFRRRECGGVDPAIYIAEVAAQPRGMRENVTTNRNRTFRAFTMEADDGFRIFIQDMRRRKTYEIRDATLPYRPFSDLVWVGDTLIFDRWSQPHYGFHYAADARRRAMILACPFPDQFYLDQQRQTPSNTNRERQN